VKNTLGLYSAAAALLLLAGCATVTKPPEGAITPPPGVQPPPAVQPGQPQPVQPPAAVAPPPIEPVQRAEMSQIPAVVALLDRAQRETDAGRSDAAGASLERALHIQPRNPWVWQQLAQVRLNEGHYDLAISLARKSNSFSGANHQLQAVNWQLIGKARVAKGDAAGATEAFKKAADLADLARAEAGKAVSGQFMRGQTAPAQAPAQPAPQTTH
jgi:tetratricopeptide (TPR) repeat protein